MDYIGMAAIIGCYVAIIALYVWVFKTIEGLKDKMNDHHQNAKMHQSSDDLVFKEVCEQKVARFMDTVKGVKEDIGEMKKDMKSGFENIVRLIDKNDN